MTEREVDTRADRDPIEIGTVWALAEDLSQDGVTYEVTSYATDSVAYRRCTDNACMYIEPALFCRNFRRLPFRREEKFDG